MPYAFLQDVPINAETYRRIRDRIGAAPLDGLLCHLVIRRSSGTLRYIDVWESEAHCERAFAERIHPAVAQTFAETGFRPDGEPVREPLEIVDYEFAARGPGSVPLR